MKYQSDVIEFLRDIGIEVILVDEVEGFLDHIEIVNGTLHITSSAPPSDILHEAGHIAIFPENYRHMVNGNIDECCADIFDQVQDLHPEHPLIQALLQCSETEATAWAWAAGKHLGMEEPHIITNDAYDNEGESIRLALSMNSYFGINGMAAAGMTTKGMYPKMLKWTQDFFDLGIEPPSMKI